MGSVPTKVQQGQGPTQFHKQWTNFESVFHIYLYIKKCMKAGHVQKKMSGIWRVVIRKI